MVEVYQRGVLNHTYNHLRVCSAILKQVWVLPITQLARYTCQQVSTPHLSLEGSQDPAPQHEVCY
jgi:hypothetical protein